MGKWNKEEILDNFKKLHLTELTTNEGNKIYGDKIIDTITMSEEMLDKIGSPIIYKP